ncbi:MAG: class I SAM-dependent methyltransferase [Phycisphaerae bacterium]
MSHRALQAHYRPNWRLAQATRFQAFNCGYQRSAADTFATHQQSLLWQLVGDTPISGDTVVLDVGCGIGGPIGWIVESRRPARAIGIDFCAENVAHARDAWADQNGHSPVFLRGDAHRLPLSDASVDVLVNLESALHYRDKPTFLRECRRVLRPGGVLCLGDITSRYKRTINLLGNLARSHITLFSPDDYRRALPAAGFQIAAHEDASLPVSRSLDAGLAEARRLSIRERLRVASRLAFLRILQQQLARGWVSYDLFRARPA